MMKTLVFIGSLLLSVAPAQANLINDTNDAIEALDRDEMMMVSMYVGAVNGLCEAMNAKLITEDVLQDFFGNLFNLRDGKWVQTPDNSTLRKEAYQALQLTAAYHKQNFPGCPVPIFE